MKEAIKKLKKFPTIRLEVFEKSADGYRPTYVYYLNGELVNGA